MSTVSKRVLSILNRVKPNKRVKDRVGSKCKKIISDSLMESRSSQVVVVKTVNNIKEKELIDKRSLDTRFSLT